MDNLQLLETFFGGLISFLLIVIGFFLRQSIEEMKSMMSKINDHESRLDVHDSLHERHTKDIEKIIDSDPYEGIQKSLSEIMFKLGR